MKKQKFIDKAHALIMNAPSISSSVRREFLYLVKKIKEGEKDEQVSIF